MPISDGIFLTLFGVVFALAGWAIPSSIDSNWQKVQGTVTAVERQSSQKGSTWSPIVSYEVQGNTYTRISSFSSSPAPAIGSTKTVFYNPQQPDESIVPGPRWFPWIFRLTGLAVAFLGLWHLGRRFKRTRDIRWLLQNGERTQGIITHIEESRFRTDKRNRQHLLVSHVLPSGEIETIKSEAVLSLNRFVQEKIASTKVVVDVYLDPTGERAAHIDLSTLPTVTADDLSDTLAEHLSTTKKNTPGA